MRWFLFIVLCLLPSSVSANGQKTDVLISFHLETTAGSGKKLSFPQQVAGAERHFSRAAVLTHSDFIAFQSFPASDGSFGVVFLLKDTSAKRYYNMLLQAKGTYMLAQVNGRFPDAVLVDQPRMDRQVVIWRGITAAEIKQYDQLLPRISELKKAKKR